MIKIRYQISTNLRRRVRTEVPCWFSLCNVGVRVDTWLSLWRVWVRISTFLFWRVWVRISTFLFWSVWVRISTLLLWRVWVRMSTKLWLWWVRGRNSMGMGSPGKGVGLHYQMVGSQTWSLTGSVVIFLSWESSCLYRSLSSPVSL